jgi:hypothetical protein
MLLERRSPSAAESGLQGATTRSRAHQCQELTFAPSGLSATIHLGSFASHAAITFDDTERHRARHSSCPAASRLVKKHREPRLRGQRGVAERVLVVRVPHYLLARGGRVYKN